MFSFRQKIFVTYIIVFFVFIAFMFPLAKRTVRQIVQKGMEDRASELISRIQQAENNDALVTQLKEQKPLIFFRVSVISNERKVLYDSHTKRVLGPRFSQEFVVSHPEVLRAFKEGQGYTEEYSEILSQEFAYFAKAFNFHGKTYVMRIAFPMQYVDEITNDFEYGFIGTSVIILLLFSMMTWFIINYLTKPIQQIIKAVRPYQQGETATVPTIDLKTTKRTDEFGQLANTLNSLSVRIQGQIESITLERNEKEAVLESLTEGVIAVDDEGVVKFANTIALKFLKVTPEQILDKPLKNIGQSKCIQILRECQKENRILNDTLEEGKKFYDLVAAPTKDQQGAILVIQDKTEHYRIIEMRKDFVANASHELKTPITIIQGFAEALHDNPDLPKETNAEITSKIVRNCEKMSDLIKDLLTLTDIEHIPESRLHECDLVEMVKNAKTTVQELYPTANIRIENPENQTFNIQADPKLLDLALINLIENGAKYSQEPADITIAFKKTEKWAIISIADKGYGIPKSELENIFQRFYRVTHSTRKKIGGSGLGLSIVETIISKHFGKITAESEEGKGSIFTIYLPL